MSPTRKERKAATRNLLKTAAKSCFETNSFAGTQMADIASEAGVAHGTFYVHFDSKEAVLDELLAEFNADMAAHLSPGFHAEADAPLETIVGAVATRFLTQWQRHSAFVACVAERMSLGTTVSSLTGGINPPVTQLLHSALEAAALQRGVELPNASLATHGLLAMWLRIGLRYLFEPTVTKRVAVRTLVTMTVGAVQSLLSSTKEYDT